MLALLSELGATLVGGAPTAAATTPSAAMPPPAGYTAQQLIFDDRFSGTSLDRSKWTTLWAAEGEVWNDHRILPTPYSGPNDTAHGGDGLELAMFGPSQVAVDNGLTLTAQRNRKQWASTFPWISGLVTTEGKFTLPTSGWYVQVKAKMPDTNRGMWPGIWFMPAVAGTSVNELDGYEGGFIFHGPPNHVVHSTYFPSGKGLGNNAIVNASLPAGFHVYGIEWKPGVSITIYLDGTQVWQLTEAEAGSIPAEPYEIILQLSVASTKARFWHTVTNTNTPTSSMHVAEVQAYS